MLNKWQNLNISKNYANPSHAVWVVVQQFAVRGMIALKFLLAASLLGPDKIGLAGIAILAVAIVESISDTGLAPAVVQSPNKINRMEAGAVWTLQLTRGLVLSILLFSISGPLAIAFELPNSASLITIAAALPLLRNAVNPGIFLVQRDRDFRQLSIYEASAALIDLLSTLLLIKLEFGAASILIGNIASESLKLILTWTCCRTALSPNFQWQSIKSLTSFGKWIWGASLVTLVLNQFDKILVARFLGATEFGLYQVASRIAQLIIADGAMALGQYLLPVFAEKYRLSKKDAYEYFIKIMEKLIILVFPIAFILAIFSESFISLMVGPDWSGAGRILRVMSFSMFLGAIIAVTTAYCKAMGKPEIVTLAVLIQLGTLIVSAPLLITSYGSVGIASANGIALTSAIAVLMIQLQRLNR